MTTHADRDRRSLHRRSENLGLPVVPLRRHGWVRPSDRALVTSEPQAVGVGPGGTALAVWTHRRTPRRKQVTVHDGGELAGAIDVETDLAVSFVQPLPGERVLLAAARARPGETNAEVWTDGGVLERRGSLGDAIEELLTTPSGRIWVGYFDEAMGGSGPEGHGLARFTADLAADWLFPLDTGLPAIADCYALNVDGDTAHVCPYTDFHLLSASAGGVTDRGPSPYRSARNLLVRGDDWVLVGGWGPDYDLVTPLHAGPDGVRRAGDQRRIVLPDGLEAHSLRYTCRGADLHALTRTGAWYRTGLDALTAVADPHRMNGEGPDRD
ncbi:hypothetical protein [Spirilliplanes yamanashiensis]|uniref:Uncharacterized protein n=1 Tax=Spirilliplanes yamanashiensis TaxID=42233 RepID=A0A8J3Y6Z5_9ACTN|nr:hypothetical protein [Spirilliplanes yamanashiensis]MDP9815033.1 hypothetical protein [Spirilliplanes yamanashiensis]GIJ02690.1 hypothetical protein Sya03_20420 [Spirilliplanes yamanashiensis]